MFNEYQNLLKSAYTSFLEKKSNNTLKREHFELSITTRDYSNDRIKAVVKEYISEEFFDKDEIYEGLTNSEIEQCGYEVYQLNQPTFSAYTITTRTRNHWAKNSEKALSRQAKDPKTSLPKTIRIWDRQFTSANTAE